MLNFFERFLPSEMGFTDIERQQIINNKSPFSKYLPYDSYDSETGFFKNKDGSYGFIFLCYPFWNENEKARTIFKAIIQEMPQKSCLSIHLLSLDYMTPILQQYVNLKLLREDPLIERASRSFVKFLQKSIHSGLPNLLGTLLKRFILLVSFKFSPGEKNIEQLTNYKINIEQQLKGSGLYPEPVNGDQLLNIIFNSINGKWLDLTYDAKRSLSSQMILSDTIIENKWNHLKTGNKKWICISFKNLPKDEFETSTIGELIGPSEGAHADGKQIKSHFIFTTIIYKNNTLHGELTKKAGLFFNQLKGDAHKSIIGRLIGEYAIEHSQAVEDIEKGDSFLYVIPFCWIWDTDEKRLKQSAQQLRSLLEENGFPSQQEIGILPILFLMNFPFGFNLSPSELKILDRHFPLKPETAAGLLPLVGDISGFGEPACLYVSRKGQLITFDPFCKDATNKNCIVMGTTGGGKSVNMNIMVYSMYASGSMVRIIDLGYSYLKQCKLFKGEYIDFSEKKPICLNPFSYLNKNSDDFSSSLEFIIEMVLSMSLEGSQEKITKEHIALIRSAVLWAWNEWETEAGINQIYEYLAQFPDMAGDEIGKLCENEETCLVDLKKEAQKIAFSLIRWTNKGFFGPWFNGKATLDLVSSEYIVLELEKLKKIKPLLKIVALAIMNAVTNSFYLTNKNKKKFFLIEECGIILKDIPGLNYIIQETYRRIRKYNGAVVTTFQSPMDIKDLGETGRVMLGNSAYWFMLPSNQYELANKEKIVMQSPHVLKILSSISLNAPRYGEAVLKTPFGTGVVRTILNGFFYYLVTTDPDDWQEVMNEAERRKQKLIEKGVKDPESQAILEVMEEFGAKRDEEFIKKFM